MSYSTKKNDNGSYDVVSDLGSVHSTGWSKDYAESQAMALNAKEMMPPPPPPPPPLQVQDFPLPPPQPKQTTNLDDSRGWLWIAPIAEVLIVGLGIFFHLLVEALLLVNIAIGAVSLVILSVLALTGKAKKTLWLVLVVLTAGIGYITAKGYAASGTFVFWIAVVGAAFTIYSVYRLATGKRVQ